MHSNNRMAKAMSELANEMDSFSDVAKELKELKGVIENSNEELIATFVEGTKRILKKDGKDVSPSINNLAKSTTEGLEAVKRGVAEVERGVKSIKLPSNVDFRATGAMLKLPIKELTRAIKEKSEDLPRSAKDPISVRLSDGENFYKALDQVIQQISGGGGSSYAFDTQGGSPTKAATVQVSIGGKTRDAIVVVNPDGTEVGGSAAGGGLTDAELRATPVPVSGTVAATQSGVWDEVGINDSGNSITVDQLTASNLNAQVVGDIAAAATDSGNPVKVGAKYNATLPTYTDGQRGDLQINTKGLLRVGLYTDGTGAVVTYGADNADGVVVASGATKLHTLNRNTVFNGTGWDRMYGDTTGIKVQSHAVTNIGTFAVQVDGAALTSLQLIDNAISGAGFNITQFNGEAIDVGAGTEASAIRVTLPTDGTGKVGLNSGTNNIGDVDILTIAAGDNNIGNVDIVSGTINTVTTVSTVSALGISTTGPQKAEDVASAGGDMGILAMASRLDTPVANAGVSNDGDYTGLILDNFRKLWVTGTVLEDTAHVAGEAIVVNGVRRIDTAATSAGSSGDWATMDSSAEGAIWSTLTPTTTSGLSTFMASGSDGSSILVATAQVVKASAGNLYGYYLYNPESAASFVHFYNTAAASVTVGTTNPLFTVVVPATSAANLSFPYPITFSNAGWSIAATTTAGGNTAPATGVSAVVWYK